MVMAGLYSLRQALSYIPNFWGPSSFFEFRRPMNDSPSFCHSELQRALEEQAFGIKKFAITSSSGQNAVASVVLLDGVKLMIELTTQGYSIVSTNNIYENIEDLLQAASPMYTKKRQELLYAKLAKLSTL